jgi:hypothetical protein
MKAGSIAAVAAVIGIGGVLVCGAAAPGHAAPVSAQRIYTRLPIRSRADLDRYRAATASSGSPLDALSPAGRRRFLASLRFNRSGITGFSYADLQSELTASQIYDVLKLFGAEKDVAIIPHVRVETPRDRQVMEMLHKR